MDAPPSEDLETPLTLAEVCDLLRIHKNTGWRLAAAGKLPGQLPRIGRDYRFARPAVEASLRGEGERVA